MTSIDAVTNGVEWSVCLCVCLCGCWSRWWALQKWLNWTRCHRDPRNQVLDVDQHRM